MRGVGEGWQIDKRNRKKRAVKVWFPSPIIMQSLKYFWFRQMNIWRGKKISTRPDGGKLFLVESTGL